MFPEAFPQNKPLPKPRVAQTNFAYDGWFVQADNLFFANGHRASHSLSLPRIVCHGLTCNVSSFPLLSPFLSPFLFFRMSRRGSLEGSDQGAGDDVLLQHA